MIREFFRTFRCFDTHHRFFVALALALLALGIGWAAGETWPVWLLTGWDTFAVCSLALAWWRIARADAPEVMRAAKRDDASNPLIFVIVVLGACASLLGTGYLLFAAKELGPGAKAASAVLAIGTVFSSWALIHTSFALRYAHQFYQADDDKEEIDEDGGSGVDFPGEEQPDYFDFAYFSFSIGMSTVVSDVQITGREHRRLALFHGWLAFLFNTVILAMLVNLAASLV